MSQSKSTTDNVMQTATSLSKLIQILQDIQVEHEEIDEIRIKSGRQWFAEVAVNVDEEGMLEIQPVK